MENAIEVAGDPCDHYPDEPAIFSYVWDWGETGKCGARRAVELNQIATQTKRGVQLAPLRPGAQAPLERPERAKLKGEVYALEEELKETKQRGLELYRQNGLLAQQVQALSVRNREGDAQLTEARTAAQKAEAERDRFAAEAGELSDEVSRLRILMGGLESEEGTKPGAGG